MLLLRCSFQCWCAVAEVLQALLAALKDSFSRMPTAGMLIDRYAKLCLIVDEVINEVRDSP